MGGQAAVLVAIREAPIPNDAALNKLQAGERCAITLAQSMNAKVILLDEKTARTVASARGLRVTGTIGVLVEAATRGMIDLASAFDRLTRTNFRCSPALLKAALDLYRANTL